ncbi:EpsG family protein [Pseudophaeobacter sp.]|uniref:EpsG family protein n=1 Tax=Pseudophaeobacter sp. TaxID=1971739 RepID=UPI00261EEC68|nr:EpsG family protein [Pseudophaeobacter sp.]
MFEALFLSNVITLSLGLLMALATPRRETFLLISVFSISIQSVIIGLRNPGMMTDTREYAALFEGTSGFEDRIEPFFMALIYTFRQVTDSVGLFLIGVSVLINVIYFLILDIILRRYALLAFGLFSSTFSYWLIHVQLIRNGLACVLLLLAIVLIVNGKLRRGLVFFVLALGNHFSIAVISIGAFLGYTLSEFNFRRFFAILSLMVGAYMIYEYALPTVPSLAPWKQRLDAYEYYNRNSFISSSFGYIYAYFLLIVVGFPLLWRRHCNVEKVLFYIYISVAALSFVFWFNILFRDRIFLFAQIMEPILIALVAKNGLGRRDGAFVVFGFSILASLLVIYVWGPRTVLVF